MPMPLFLIGADNIYRPKVVQSGDAICMQWVKHRVAIPAYTAFRFLDVRVHDVTEDRCLSAH